jgi:hypothetical protein
MSTSAADCKEYLQDIDASRQHVGADEDLALAFAIVIDNLRQTGIRDAESTRGGIQRLARRRTGLRR